MRSAKEQDSEKNKSKKEACKFALYRGKKFSFENSEVLDSTLYNPLELKTELVSFNILNTYEENFYLRDKVFERTSS